MEVTSAPNISVIDDDESLRGAIVGLVLSLGYAARGFASAEEFLRSGLVERFSCVVTDVQMPGMSGLDLQTHLRVSSIRLPVIMITARNDPALRAKALAGGAVCFLRKPFDDSVLLACLERALAPST